MRYSMLLLIILASIKLTAGQVNLAELKSNDEIVKIRALWAIAQAGKSSRITEADILPLMTKSWEGRRLSKWCLHALTKIGVSPNKNLDAFLDAATWMEKLPPDDQKKKMAAEWRMNLEGPELPEELKKATTVVWGTAVVAVVSVYEQQERELDTYRRHIEKLRAPSDLIMPRLTKIILDIKKTPNQRRSAALTIGYLHHHDAAIDALIIGLSDPNAPLRATCAMSLGRLALIQDVYGNTSHSEYKHPDPEKALDALLKAAKADTDLGVRRAAVGAIRTMHSEGRSAIPALIEMSRTEKTLRRDLLGALAEFKALEAIPLCVELLSDPEEQTQIDALNGLQNINAFQGRRVQELINAIPKIEKVMNETNDPKVKAAAEFALKSIGRR